ncbi:MAG TPA: Rid family hydrolase [Steroidobacteraceae bacterium]|nr:Rid family hydrolase [Steroidobacteraceae bacterium]
MKFRYLSALLLVAPCLAFAQHSGRTYFNSPLAQQRHLPFSSGVLVGNTLYIAGTTGVDPGTKGAVSAVAEAHLVMDRVKRVVEQSGMTMDDIVSVQVFCTDLRDYDAFNSVYESYFHGHYPARTFIGVASLLFGARYEVNGIAVRRANSVR